MLIRSLLYCTVATSSRPSIVCHFLVRCFSLSSVTAIQIDNSLKSREKHFHFTQAIVISAPTQRSEHLFEFTSPMENISKVWTGPLPADSPYVKPFRLYFVQNGVEKNWDLLKVHDSVAIIIYNKTRNALVFVKQFRPAVYHGVITAAGLDVGDIDLEQFPPKLGITLEMCAGIVDKDKSWIEIAREEVIEECGYDVPAERLEEVITCRSGVGASGALMKMYYCEVTDADKVTSGGGVDEELIDVVEYSVDRCRELVAQGANVNSPPSFLFGVLWFLSNKAPKDDKQQ